MTISEDDYQGDHTISLETQSDLMGDSVYAYVWDNFESFLVNLRNLSEEDQELLLSYYLLGKTQTALAVVNKSTQTICSTKVRMAAKRLGAYILIGELTHETLTGLLTKAGTLEYEKDTSVSMADIVFNYSQLGSAQAVADTLGVYRPDVRRSMTALAKDLMSRPDLKLTALGALIQGMIDRSSINGYGPSKSRMLARGNMFRKDPEILGDFEIQLENEGFQDVLYPRANQ